jgi:hypothetical protein
MRKQKRNPNANKQKEKKRNKKKRQKEKQRKRIREKAEKKNRKKSTTKQKRQNKTKQNKAFQRLQSTIIHYNHPFHHPVNLPSKSTIQVHHPSPPYNQSNHPVNLPCSPLSKSVIHMDHSVNLIHIQGENCSVINPNGSFGSLQRVEDLTSPVADAGKLFLLCFLGIYAVNHPSQPSKSTIQLNHPVNHPSKPTTKVNHQSQPSSSTIHPVKPSSPPSSPVNHPYRSSSQFDPHTR